jgi:hypothetical protein
MPGKPPGMNIIVFGGGQRAFIDSDLGYFLRAARRRRREEENPAFRKDESCPALTILPVLLLRAGVGKTDKNRSIFED